MSLIFRLPDSNQRLHFSDTAIQTLGRYRQTGTEPEAGGMLFARIALPDIYVDLVSTPKGSDLRSRLSFILHRPTKRRLIARAFAKGLHYIGEWHTHPEEIPHPSTTDLTSMRDAFAKSNHELHHFVMVILGYGRIPDALWVSIHNTTAAHRLSLLRK